MSMVITATSIKAETHTLLELRDLEDLIINTMGEDVWLAIMYFIEEKTEETEENNKYAEEDIRSYDVALTALRSDVQYALEEIEKLQSYTIETKRLNRDEISKRLTFMKRQLEDSEGY